jgi:hypothetical protein
MQLNRDHIFKALKYEPRTQDVWDFHNSKARVRIICAPARTSKSWASGQEISYQGLPLFEKRKGKWMPIQDRLSWIVGPDYNTNKEFQYVYQNIVEGPLRARADRVGSQHSPPGKYADCHALPGGSRRSPRQGYLRGQVSYE